MEMRLMHIREATMRNQIVKKMPMSLKTVKHISVMMMELGLKEVKLIVVRKTTIKKAVRLISVRQKKTVKLIPIKRKAMMQVAIMRAIMMELMIAEHMTVRLKTL